MSNIRPIPNRSFDRELGVLEGLATAVHADIAHHTADSVSMLHREALQAAEDHAEALTDVHASELAVKQAEIDGLRAQLERYPTPEETRLIAKARAEGLTGLADGEWNIYSDAMDRLVKHWHTVSEPEPEVEIGPGFAPGYDPEPIDAGPAVETLVRELAKPNPCASCDVTPHNDRAECPVNGKQACPSPTSSQE